MSEIKVILLNIQGGLKTGLFGKFVTPLCVDVEKGSIYQTVQFFIYSKNGVMYVTVFKYSLRNFIVRTLHSK